LGEFVFEFFYNLIDVSDELVYYSLLPLGLPFHSILISYKLNHSQALNVYRSHRPVILMPDKNVWEIFSKETPKVAEAWMKMAEAVNIDGVLDQKTVFLIRIAIYSTTRDPVALRHFVGEAFKAGISKKEIQVAALMPWCTGVTVSELSIPLIQEVEESL